MHGEPGPELSRKRAGSPLTGYRRTCRNFGTGTGWVDGQAPLTGYAMWLLWSGESRSRPFQHCGKSRYDSSIVPAGQLMKSFDGGVGCRQDQREMVSVGPVALALPATIRSPNGSGWVFAHGVADALTEVVEHGDHRLDRVLSRYRVGTQYDDLSTAGLQLLVALTRS